MKVCGKNPARVVAALFFAIAAANTPVGAQAGSAEDVTRQMAGVLEVFTGHGLRQVGAPFTGTLNDDAQALHRVQLTAGVRYAVAGVCDNDCTDFDLQLSDAGGNAVAADVEADDTPVVTFTPARSGVFTVRGVMASCSQEPCYYGIGVYGGASSAAAAATPARPNPAASAAAGAHSAAVQPGVYSCSETVNVYAGSTYTSAGSMPIYTSSLQTRVPITITGHDSYRVGDTSGKFAYDAATGGIRWLSGSLALDLVRGGRYAPNAQTRTPELVVLTSSGQWICVRG